jgi:hypothetical protein
MQCRACGTDIADNALICYRCGTATTEPIFKPPPSRGRYGSPSLLLLVTTLLLVVLVAVYLARMSTGSVPPAMGWAIAGVAAVLLLLRMMARRRG